MRTFAAGELFFIMIVSTLPHQRSVLLTDRDENGRFLALVYESVGRMDRKIHLTVGVVKDHAVPAVIRLEHAAREKERVILCPLAVDPAVFGAGDADAVARRIAV